MYIDNVAKTVHRILATVTTEAHRTAVYTITEKLKLVRIFPDKGQTLA